MKNLLRRVLTVALCAALVGGTAASLPVFLPDSGITASAAENLTYGDFEYTLLDDGSVGIADYNGSGGAVTIPSKIAGKSVTNIGYYAFSECSSLTSITIPSGVTSIKESAFSNCSNLTSINVDSNNNNYSSVDDLLYNKDKTKLIICPSGKITANKIPSSVTSIDSAFRYCSSLTSVTIPSSATSIGDSAFRYCSDLKDITIPDSVTSIGSSAFDSTEWYDAQSNGLVYIGKFAYGFKGTMDNGTSVALKNGTKGIADEAFKDCSKLKSITIPSTVVNIGNSAFEGCSLLTDITLPSSIVSIGEWAFRGCTGLKSLTIPSGVKSIYYGAFTGCTGLTRVTIPSTVVEIDEDVFSDCTSFTSVTIPSGIKSISRSLFEGCSGLTNVSIPSGVTKIEDWAFRNCTSLKSITIPSAVTEIGEWAFRGCSSLSDITIPDSVKIIGSGVFDGTAWYNAKPDGIIYIGKIAYKYKGEMPSGTKVVLKDNVSLISDSAFSGCEGLSSITIPNTVTQVGEGAFANCTGLKSINIPSSVENIEAVAFWGCNNITSITISDGVKSIGESAFSSCSNLKSITIPSSVTNIGYTALGFNYVVGISMDKLDYPMDSNSGFNRIDGFTIYGVMGSAAEKYASEYGFKFVAQSEVQPTGITLNKTSLSLEKGKSIKLTATVSPSNSTDKTVKWTTDKSYIASVDSTGLIKANSCGTATITAKTSNGKTATCKVTVYEALKNNSEISASSVSENTNVTLTGKATGGTAPYTFAYYYKKSTDSAWTKIAGYSTATSKTFNPISAGTYTARVNVKDSTGTLVQKDFTITVKDDALKNNSTVSATSVTANTNIAVIGKATGGTAPYTYAYYYKKSTDSSWTKIAGYSNSTMKTFKPTTPGTYTARVNVKDSTGKLVQKDITITVKAAALTNNSTVSATSITAGTEVTMTGKAVGGTSPYKYAYYYKKSTDSSWTKAYVTSKGSAYTKYDSMKFTPKTAGTYDVRINVKDEYGNGKTVTKDFKLTVK